LPQATQPDLSCMGCEAAGRAALCAEPLGFNPSYGLESGVPERYDAFGSFGMTKLPQLRWE